MTRDDIIKGAEESGWVWGNLTKDQKECILYFARLVETATTEATNERANASWTLMCEKMVAAEREACAKVCDELAELSRTSDTDSMWEWGECAAAIRARGNV